MYTWASHAVGVIHSAVMESSDFTSAYGRIASLSPVPTNASQNSGFAVGQYHGRSSLRTRTTWTTVLDLVTSDCSGTYGLRRVAKISVIHICCLACASAPTTLCLIYDRTGAPHRLARNSCWTNSSCCLNDRILPCLTISRLLKG